MAAQDLAFFTASRPRDWVPQNRAFTFTVYAYSGNTHQSISSATISIRKPGGAALTTPVSAAAMTIDGSNDATYQIASGNTSELGANYIADVAATISGVVYDFRFLFDVVRSPIRNPVIQADLVYHHPDVTDLLTTGESNAATYIKQAFEDVCGFIDSRGDRPYLVLNSEQLRRPIEHRALALFFFAKQKSSDDRWGTYAASHESAYQAALASLGPKLVYDFDNSGTADGTDAEGKAGEEGRKAYGLRYRV